MTCKECGRDIFTCRCDDRRPIEKRFTRAEVEVALRERLTSEWFDTLFWAARVYGHHGDFEEVLKFMLWLWELSTGDEGFQLLPPLEFADDNEDPRRRT